MRPGQPHIQIGVFIRVKVKGKELIGVVFAYEVGRDGGAFEDGAVVVIVVNDGGDPSVGVDGGEPGVFLDVVADVDGLAGILKIVFPLEFF